MCTSDRGYSSHLGSVPVYRCAHPRTVPAFEAWNNGLENYPEALGAYGSIPKLPAVSYIFVLIHKCS